MGYWGYNANGQYGWIEDGSGGQSSGGGGAGSGNNYAPPPGVPQGGGGSGGGGNYLQDAAAAYAQQRAGYSPHKVMQEGHVEIRDGVPGVMIKYDTPQGSSTEWTPINQLPAGTSNVPMYEWGAGGGAGGVYGGAGGGGGSGGALYDQAKSLTQAQGAADLTATRGLIQQALIAFGLVPGTYQDKLNALDEVTRSLIEQNTSSGISAYARMQQSKNDNLRGLLRRLGATGSRRSGTKGYQMRRQQLDFDRMFQDALGGLLGQIGGYYQNYTNNEYQRQMGLLNFLMQSQMGNFSMPSGGGGGSPSFTPAWQGTWAEGIDTGGYVPNSNVLTNVDPMQGTSLINFGGGWKGY